MWTKVNREEAGKEIREEPKRSQTVGAVEHLVLLSMMGSAWIVFCRGLRSKPNQSCTVVKEVTANFIRNYCNRGKGTDTRTRGM